MVLSIGCQVAPAPVSFFPVSDSATRSLERNPEDALRPDDRSTPLTTVRLAGANNETVSFQFAVPRSSLVPGSGRWVASALTGSAGRIDSAAVQMYRVLRVQVPRWPGWHLRSVPPHLREPNPWDVLLPVSAGKAGANGAVAADGELRYWVDIAIPKGTAEGVYRAALEWQVNHVSAGRCEIELTVWPFVLPDDAMPTVLGELDHRMLFRHHVRRSGAPYTPLTDDWRADPLGAALDGVLRDTMRMLQQYRVTAVLAKLAPILQVTPQGALSFDWQAYDETARPALDGSMFYNRLGVSHWPVPVLPITPNALRTGTNRTAALPATFVNEYLRGCVDHFTARKWLERSYALAAPSMFDAVSRKDCHAPSWGESGAVFPRSLQVSRVPPQDLGPFGWTDYPCGAWTAATGRPIAGWMPPGQFYDPATMRGERGAGRRTWMEVDRPPYTGTMDVRGTSADVRALGWQGYRLGAAVLFVGSINDWPEEVATATPDACLQHDARALLYPGSTFGLDRPVASIRLAELRRSAQDAAYIQLLALHGLDHIPQALGAALAPSAGTESYRTHFADGRAPSWTTEIAHYDAARRIMAEELLRKVHPAREIGGEDAFSRNAAWRRVMLETRDLQLQIDGVRLRPDGGQAKAKIRLETVLTATNRGRLPLEGQLDAGPLPAGFAPVGREPESVRLDAGASRRIRLDTSGTDCPRSPVGSFDVPMTWHSADGARQAVVARGAALTPLGVDVPPRIDGDLSDWPAGTNNVAGDFALITRNRAGAFGDESAARPRAATVAFVMRGAQDLFVAVRANSAKAMASPDVRRNRVHYEDMVPVGDELVEVLIDPLNGGTRSPADLYHIAVKPSGAAMLERGVSFDPPCGERRAWSADAEIATRVEEAHWTVEMRIPLAAFGEIGTRQTIWGFNVTRFDLEHQEFSTWSGASPNAYDPLSLGNLCLP